MAVQILSDLIEIFRKGIALFIIKPDRVFTAIPHSSFLTPH